MGAPGALEVRSLSKFGLSMITVVFEDRSLMPLMTALKGTNSQRVMRAMSWARVVLPTPGGPHRMRLFSSSRSESVRHNVQWHEEPLDLDLLAAVRQVLAPVMDKQWDYDAAVARLMKTGTPPPTDFGAAKSARNRDHARPLSPQAPTAGISPA